MRYGLPAPLAPLARLNVPGIARPTLARLHENEKGVRLSDPDDLLDAGDDELDGLLTPTQALRLKAAIVAERGETLRRKQAGHLVRAEERGFKVRLVEELYTAGGAALEVAVTDSLRRRDGVTGPQTASRRRGHPDRDAERDGCRLSHSFAGRGEARQLDEGEGGPRHRHRDQPSELRLRRPTRLSRRCRRRQPRSPERAADASSFSSRSMCSPRQSSAAAKSG